MPETIRTHRVGTITTGLCFVGFGIAFLIHTVLGILTYESILAAWPVILIVLGIEVLLSNSFKQRFEYDKAGAAMMIIMGMFSMCMACAEMCLKYADKVLR